MTDPVSRKRSGRYILWAGMFVLGLVVGGTFGLWAGGHYRLVPVEPTGVTPEATAPEDRADLGTTADVTPEATPPTASAGPYTFKFTPEELLHYRVDAAISGKGADGGLAADVNMDFMGDFDLYTKAVDGAGVADLRVLFENASLQGDFLGTPFEMGYDEHRAYIYDGRTRIDTERGDSVQGIPQMDYFRQPISLRVASNGEVLDVSGQAGLTGLLTALPALARVEFPENEIGDGTQWESRIKMPVPGFGTAVDTRILNTLIGYQYLGAKYCAVIQQDFGATQTDGTLNAPESALGESVQVTVPLFDLQGRNLVYFDVVNGQLVHTVLDLDLNMNFGKMLGNIVGILDQLSGGLLEEDLAGPDRSLGPEDSTADLLDLSLGIEGAITQIDPAQEALAPSTR